MISGDNYEFEKCISGIMDVLHHLFDDNIEYVDIQLCDTEASLHNALWNLFLQCLVHLIGDGNSFVLSHVTPKVIHKVTTAFKKLHIQIQIVDANATFENVPGMIPSELSQHVKLMPSLSTKIRFVFVQNGTHSCATDAARCI